MIIQLSPPLPLYSVPHQEECYAYLMMEYGQEDYMYFLVALEKTGEIWVLPHKDLRASKNFTLDRPKINKEVFSQYLKRGDSTIHPINNQEDL